MSNLLDALSAAAWAMTPDALEQLYEIAGRENALTIDVLEKIRANELARSETALQRGSVAILPLEGPMFKKANLFVRISGATSYEIARRDLQAALDNPAITSILLNIDSPGGEVTGCDELAKAIVAARSQKRIVAYVGGSAHSAAYWLASAAHEIVMSDAATAGSVGAVIGMTDTRQRDERSGVKRIEVVSSQSPDKRIDVSTEPGRAKIQSLVDDIAQVFIEAVAKHRGVTAEKVAKSYGRGGILIASKALKLGMVDRTGTFEGVIEELNRHPVKARAPALSANPVISSQAQAALLASACEEATVQATTRIASIIVSDEGKANPKLAAHLAFKTELSADEAKTALAAAAQDRPKPSHRPAGGASQRMSYLQHRAMHGGLVIVAEH